MPDAVSSVLIPAHAGIDIQAVGQLPMPSANEQASSSFMCSRELSNVVRHESSQVAIENGTYGVPHALFRWASAY
jgi:hypothetical protein